ncbi:MAG: hypothetical protein K6B64_00945, partial [Acholeplasmatales bacterium]|nr:hypothetical protein [Acholeplasmatales bacterium]
NLISVSVVKDSNKFDYYIYYKNNLIYEAKSFYNDDLELRISFDDESNIDYIYPNLDEFERYGGSDEPEENDLEEPLKEEEYLIDYDNNRTYYQILVYSFADSNGDGIGDFKGIADNLDYLVSLGVEGLWLSPILQADSYHSYDINNYYKINPKYCVTIDGTYYGINYLLKECHKRNIKVLMDLVLNHTSYFHSWYYLYEAWYSADNRFGYPELDYDNPGVVSAVKEVGNYWLQRGFDGFRLDAAMWIYNSGENRHQKNVKFWQNWCSEMKKTKPDCYLIGEVLDDDHDLAYAYNNCGFDSTFDFNALGSVINATTNNNYDYAKVTSENNKKALDENPSFIMARCLSNHDIGRFNQAHPDSNDKAYYVEDIKEIKLANAINALTPGNTFIYYGDELGLMGTCEDTRPNYYYDMNYRTPMPFTNGLTDSESYFEAFHGSGITTSKTYSNKTIEEDIADSNSIYNALKNALALKNSSEVLQKGTIKEISDLPSGLSGFDVTYNNQTIRILYISSNVTSSINYTIDGELLYNLGASVNNKTITISTCNLIAFTI